MNATTTHATPINRGIPTESHTSSLTTLAHILNTLNVRLPEERPVTNPYLSYVMSQSSSRPNHNTIHPTLSIESFT